MGLDQAPVADGGSWPARQDDGLLPGLDQLGDALAAFGRNNLAGVGLQSQLAGLDARLGDLPGREFSDRGPALSPVLAPIKHEHLAAGRVGANRQPADHRIEDVVGGVRGLDRGDEAVGKADGHNYFFRLEDNRTVNKPAITGPIASYKPNMRELS